MKRAIIALTAVALAFVSCEKDNSDDAPEAGDENIRYVKQITYTQEFYSGGYSYSATFDLQYDGANRITSLQSNTPYQGSFDYSEIGTIAAHWDYLDSTGYQDSGDLDYSLNGNGMVVEVGAEGESFGFSYEGKYAKSLHCKYVRQDNGETVEYDAVKLERNSEGKLVYIDQDGHQSNLSYKYNYKHPRINLDLNWFIISAATSGPLSVVWMGLCGRVADYLLETPYPVSNTKEYNMRPGLDHSTPSPYHFSTVYSARGEVNEMYVSPESDYPTSIIYLVNQEEFLYECDYEYKDGSWELVPGSVRETPTGNILGKDKVTISIVYRD